MAARKRNAGDKTRKRVAIMLELMWPYRRHIDVFAGTQSFAQENGCWDCVIDEHVPKALAANRSDPPYDGVIARMTRALDREARRCGIPVINVWFNSPVRSCPSVFPDFRAHGRMAAEHLLERGFRNFACLSGTGDRAHGIDVEAFHETIGEAGFACQCAVVPRHYDEEAKAFQEFHRIATKWVAGWKRPVGVFVAFFDIMGRYVAEMAKRQGWAIPEEVAILTGDNDPVLCLLPTPSLSSLDIPYARIGYRAARMLNRLMTGQQLMVPHQLVAPTGVIPRHSTDFVAVDDALVAAALRYISANISHMIDVTDVCGQVLTGRRTLERRFRNVLGRSIGDEIRRLRLERAKRDLAQCDVPLKQVAHNAGFRDAKRLHEAFHRAFGDSPSSYRDRIIVRK